MDLQLGVGEKGDQSCLAGSTEMIKNSNVPLNQLTSWKICLDERVE